jgi:hypothetical protein
MDFSSLIYVASIVEGLFTLLGLVLMVLVANFLVKLTRLVKTLDDYWRLRTAAQYADRHES